MRTALNSQKTGNSITIGWHWVYWCYTSHVNTNKGSVSAWSRGESLYAGCQTQKVFYIILGNQLEDGPNKFPIIARMCGPSMRRSPAGRASTLEKILPSTVSQLVIAGASNFTSLKLELKLRYTKLSFVPSHNTHACIFASISPKSPFRNVSMKSHTGYMQIEFPKTFFGAKFNLIPPDHSP